jgi:NitT/TauT family transport system permease protein
VTTTKPVKATNIAELTLEDGAKITEAPDFAQTRVPGQPSRFARHRSWVLGAASVLVLLGVWQLATSLKIVSPLILPSPAAIGVEIVYLVQQPEFWRDMSVSGQEFLIGFGLAIVVGLVLGLLMGWFLPIQNIFDPFVNFLNSTPRIALAPLFVIWFGIGIWSKVAIIFLGAVFPILITTIAGVQNLDRSLLRASRSFGATNLQMFRTVALPGSVPYILSGFRLGLAHALTGVVVGELIAAKAGIGLLMARAAAAYDTATVFAAVVIVAVIGLALTYGIQAIERRFQSWRPPTG